MKRPLLPALIALSALVGGARAEAQRLDGPLPVRPAIFSAVLSPSAADPVLPLATNMSDAAPSRVPSSTGPLLVPATPLTIGAANRAFIPGASAESSSPVPRAMPSTKVMIIGGTAAAVAGLIIGGDAGALIALLGTGTAIYGLYRHYSR